MQSTSRHDAALSERRRLIQWLLTGTGMPLLGITAHAAGAGMAAPELPAPIREMAYRLVKNWDFAATITNTAAMREEFFTRYIYNNGQQDSLNDEWQRYRDRDNHVFERGALALVARAPTEVAKGKIESGMLRSKWSGQYGYFECRAKVPGGRGMWPAFWLNPQDGKWPPEIDVMEIVNNGRDTTRNSFHFLHSGSKDVMPPPASSRLDKHKSYRPGFDYQDDFHTFAVLWEKDRVRHYVDDVLVVDRAFQWVHRDGSDGGPAHVLLNLAVGGKWPGPPEGDAAFPAKLLVQYIRVWQA
jgi:beta-glucanase (GH16 family)